MSSTLASGAARPLLIAIALLVLVNVWALYAIRRRRRWRTAETVDGLTGLPSRRATPGRLDVWSHGHPSVALLIIDIDRFSELNEALGTNVGDAVLVELSRRLSAFDGDAFVSRWGDDAFCLAVPHDRGQATLNGIAENVAAWLAEPMVMSGAQLSVPTRIAVGAWPLYAGSFSGLLQRLDVALRRAKASSRMIAVYDPAKDGVDPLRLALMGDLRGALDSDELRVVYQPQIRLSDGAVVGAEALIRWEHPTRGHLGPSEFIPAAEASGLIGALTRRVLKIAIADAAAWRAGGLDAKVSVNLSAQDLADATLANYIEQLLSHHGLPPQDLVLEVTESSLMLDAGIGAELLEALARDGLTVAIDDFGTGYSSLARLASMPARELKIDQHFVADLTSAGSSAVVKATIELAHSLGMRVVAEGVEDDDQISQLVHYGCDIGQGFWWGTPMPVNEFVAHARFLLELAGNPAAERDARVLALNPSTAVTRLSFSPPEELVSTETPSRWAVAAQNLIASINTTVQSMGVRTIGVLGGGLLLYVLWTVFGWGGPANREFIGDTVFAFFNGFAVVACWRASRLAAGQAARAWRFLAIGVGAYLLGDIAQLVVEVFLHIDANPSPDDILYLCLYPFAFVGLLSFPMDRRRSGRETLQLVFDIGTIAVAGAAAIWFIVIGPTVAAGGNIVSQVVAILYPVGDMVLVFGLTTAVIRGVPPAYAPQLRRIAVGMGLMVVVDLIYAGLSIHSTYRGGDAIDLGWALALSVIGLGALTRAGVGTRREVVSADDAQRRVSLLPYIGVGSAYGMLLIAGVQSGISLFPLGGLLIAAAVLTVFVAGRQFIGLQDNIQLVERYTALARTDPLTGLANRRQLMEAGERIVERSQRGGRPAAVLMIDIDHFKLLNDVGGHDVGDLVLEHVAGLCLAHVRPGDVVGRYGGDEIVIVLAETDLAGAMVVAKRIHAAVAHCALPADDLTVTLSIGAADSAAAITLSGLIRNADRALYDAKKAGRNRTCPYRPPAFAASS